MYNPRVYITLHNEIIFSLQIPSCTRGAACVQSHSEVHDGLVLGWPLPAQVGRIPHFVLAQTLLEHSQLGPQPEGGTHSAGFYRCCPGYRTMVPSPPHHSQRRSASYGPEIPPNPQQLPWKWSLSSSPVTHAARSTCCLPDLSYAGGISTAETI